VHDVRSLVDRVSKRVGEVILGKAWEIRLLLLALLAGRHVLIEDVPGVGKTTLVRTLARALGLRFQRIQFTPDLLPSDITGVNVYDPATGAFRFRPGPIMAQVVLADEINRTSPKTQSALLEAMEEGQVTVDGDTHLLPRPFLVLATQNPIEYEGTFPLPESQLDRFALQVNLGYPDPASERLMLRLHAGRRPADQVEPVADAGEVLAAQAAVAQVHAADAVADYVVRLAEATRRHPQVYLGASPRASLNLLELARASAAADGRDYVLPDDVKRLAEPVLAHRIILQPEARWEDQDARSIIREILQRVPVPMPQPGAGRQACR